MDAAATAYARGQLPGDPSRYAITVIPPSGFGPTSDVYRLKIANEIGQVAPVVPMGYP